MSAFLELDMYVVLSAQSGCWELNSGFLQQQPMLLSLEQQQSIHWDYSFAVYW